MPTKARADVHLFQRAAVHRSVAEGLAVAQAARLAGERSLKERDYRRTGLFVSLVFIVLVIVALLLKIRQLRGRQRPPTETH
jgi:hypothetical protein